MLNVICLKHGIKYGAAYVNNLRSMISRHLSMPYKFICFTEDSTDLDSSIDVRELPNLPLAGWWWKPYMFKKDLFPTGDTNLFIDLDMVIVNNIDKLVSFHPGQFCGLEDPGRVWGRSQQLGSAVLKWSNGDCSDIWEKLESNNLQHNQFRGDQDWIWSLYKGQINFYPKQWILSYKWEVRNRSELQSLGSSARFREKKNITLDSETAILAFHGYPQPHQVEDSIIVNNWR